MRPSPTPSPTRTPTPVFVLLSDREKLSRYVWSLDGPTPTPTADMIDWTRIYVSNPDGSELALLLDRWAYEVARDARWFSADGRYRIYQGHGRHGLDLFLGSLDGRINHQLTFVGQGKAYDAAWAPDGHRIAFASNQEGDDDIFVVHIRSAEDPKPRTEKLTDDAGWESDKHPAFSPDGAQIVFYSNRTGKRQLWIMNADGSGLRQLLNVDADCWDPVWFW